MPIRQYGRRHFLVGAGGAALAIPFLHSLTPRGAKAQTQTGGSRFFVGFHTGHGGVWPEYMYPSDAMLDEAYDLYSDHQIRYGRLSAVESGGNASLSKVLTAGSSALPSSLLEMMMVIRGLDIPFYVGHSSAHVLGNYERRDQGGDEVEHYVPTIDQILANSSRFYSAGDPNTLKSMHVGEGLSWTERGAGVESVSPSTSPDVLFRTLLGESEAGQSSLLPADRSGGVPEDDSRSHVLDRVAAQYEGVTKGAFGASRRLSSNDKARLSDHMDMVADLARRFGGASLGSNAACDPDAADRGNPNTQAEMYSPAYEDLVHWHQDYNAVFAAAIACGACRVATISVGNTFHPSPSFAVDWEQWHEPIAHRAIYSRSQWEREGNLPEHPQDTLVTAKNNFYRTTFVDLIGRLHEIDAGDGTTLLDKGLVMWAQESGPQTHNADSLPVVTAGSADGFFNTGHCFDLRNRNGVPLAGDSLGNDDVDQERMPGILYNQWLSNVLQSMGLMSDEFERNHRYGWAGYGYLNNESTQHWPDRLAEDANAKIPMVTR